MKEAEVIAFATPVYYYRMGGKLKTLPERVNSLFASGYRSRSVYLLTSAAENGSCTDAGTIEGINGWIFCFSGVRFTGTVFAGGVTEPGVIAEHPSLAKAYGLGLSIR